MLPVVEKARADGFTAESWAEFCELALELVERQISHIQKEEMGLLPTLSGLFEDDRDGELVMLYAEILCARLAPMKWHIAYALTVPKSSFLIGVKSERLVAAMDLLGRSFFRAVLDRPLYVDAQGEALQMAN